MREEVIGVCRSENRHRKVEKEEKCLSGKELKTGGYDTESHNLFAIIQNDATVKICEGIMKIKHAVIDDYLINQAKVCLGNNNQDIVTVEYDEANSIAQVTSIKDILNNIRASQVQLFYFILYEFNQQKGNQSIRIDVAKYFELRDIKRRKENMDRFLQDIGILSCISLDMMASDKGRNDRKIGNLINIKGYTYSGNTDVVLSRLDNTKIKYIVVEIGSWIHAIKANQYVYVREDFFRYNSKTEWIAVLLSVKFGQLVKINRGKLIDKGYWNCKINTILGYLNITEDEVYKQGYKHYYAMFSAVFKALGRESYDIKLPPLENVTSSKYFIEENVTYNNVALLEEYKSIKKR